LSVAIIGAGLTGSLVAHQLSHAKLSITVFEKSRGLGGRASTKRLPWGQFDLGVPLIPATDTTFIDFMQQLASQRQAHQWPGPEQQTFRSSLSNDNNAAQFFVFDQKMNSMCHHWLQASEVQTNSEVTEVRYQLGLGWQLCIKQHWQQVFYDVLICTAPWPQTKTLLGRIDEEAFSPAQTWASCWSIGIKLLSSIKPNMKVIHLANNALQTLVFDSEKPNRPSLQNNEQIWVAQLNHELSATLGKEGKAEAIKLACAALCQYFNLSAEVIQHTEGHFWRFARSQKGQKPLGIIHNQSNNLIAGGDWSFGASVQSTYNAAQTISQIVLQIS